MEFSVSTLNWLSFTSPTPEGRPPTPFSASALTEIIPAVSEAGFTRIGLDSFIAQDWLEPSEVEILVDCLDQYDLRCTDLGVVRVGAETGPDSARQLIPAIQALDIEICNITLESPPTKDVKQSLVKTVDIITEAGARPAIEYMAFGPLKRFEQLLSLCEHIGWERIGLLLDCWHLIHDKVPTSLIASLDAYQIALVQLSDGKRIADNADDFFVASRWERFAPGDGIFDFDAIISAIQQTGYRGLIAPEVLGGSAGFATALEYAKHLRGKLEVLFNEGDDQAR